MNIELSPEKYASVRKSVSRRRDRTRAGSYNRNRVFERIEAVLGQETTLRLLEQVGGRLLYVRLAPDGGPSDVVSAAIGLEDSRRLSARFGGETLTLPVRDSPYRASLARSARIRELDAAGLTAAAIAIEVGCSQRWVNFVLNGK
jgi:hypothetical protein